MSNFMVMGHINIETTLGIDEFPIEYAPVRYPFFGIKSTVSGVGFNIAKALTTLGHNVNLLSLIGDDIHAPTIKKELEAIRIPTDNIVTLLQETAQSIIIYGKSGQRAIYTDLKDVQEKNYPESRAEQVLEQCDIAVICNINFARPLLEKAKKLNKLIASDIHTIANISDPYNQDWMRHANILFMSHENLPVSPEAWIRQLWQHYQTDICVIGLGKNGALLGIRQEQQIEHIPAISPHQIVSTVGAGDALFSSFLHAYSQTQDPRQSLKKAMIFASCKIGTSGAAEGFINAEALDQLYTRYY